MVKEGGVYEQQKSQDQSNGHGGSRSNGSGTCPVTAFAVTGDQVAADGTYTSTAQVNRDPVADVDDDWADYGVSVELTVKMENLKILQ